MNAKGVKMNYKKWIIDDLQDLEKCEFALVQMQSELHTLETEFTAIKATNYDKIPIHSGENTQEEKLLTAIAKKAELEANLKATSLHVDDMYRILKMLPDDERRILERMFIHREKYAADNLAAELCYDTSKIYRLKNAALTHFAQLRFGTGYRP